MEVGGSAFAYSFFSSLETNVFGGRFAVDLVHVEVFACNTEGVSAKKYKIVKSMSMAVQDTLST